MSELHSGHDSKQGTSSNSPNGKPKVTESWGRPGDETSVLSHRSDKLGEAWDETSVLSHRSDKLGEAWGRD